MCFPHKEARPANSVLIRFFIQAQLKQREGEIVQLQMEVSGLERVKEGLSSELGRLNQRADQVQQLQEELQRLGNAYKETEQKYQTMLTVNKHQDLKQVPIHNGI